MSRSIHYFIARASWDDGQICSNGQAWFGNFARSADAKAECTKRAGHALEWSKGLDSSAEVASDADGWKLYIVEPRELVLQ